jgi:WD40 repeat protein
MNIYPYPYGYKSCNLISTLMLMPEGRVTVFDIYAPRWFMRFHRSGSLRLLALRASAAFAVLSLLSSLLIGAGHAQEAPLRILNRPPSTVLDIQCSPDSRYLARVYAEGRLEVLEAFTGTVVLEDRIDLPNSLLRAKIDWSPAGDRLAAGIGAAVYIWDVENAQLLEIIQSGDSEPLAYNESGYYAPEGVVSLQWDSTGLLLMAQSMSSRYTIWSIEQQTFQVNWVIGNDPVLAVWMPNDRQIYIGSRYLDTQTQEFEAVRAERIPQVTGRCGAFVTIASNIERTFISYGTGNGCIVIVDALTGDQIAGYQIVQNGRDGNPIWDVSWSPDSSAIVAVDSQGTVQVLNVATGAVTLLAQHEGALYAVDWADDGSAIAYGGSTTAEESIFGIVTVAEVEARMASEARMAEFAITPAADR